MKQERIKQLLPSVFQRTSTAGDPMNAVLATMETLHGPTERILDNIDAVFDPYRSPEKFVPYLAAWVDLEVLLDVQESGHQPSREPLSTGVGRLRELTAAASVLSKWRGTQKGLLLFLETATGMQGFRIDENVRGRDGTLRPFHLRVCAPAVLVDRTVLISRIIELEKPAYVTYELSFE